MKKGLMSKATLSRVPIYLRYLKEISGESNSTISAPKIAKGVSLGEVQVRKDLSLVSGRGKPRTGYERKQLIKDLENCLGASNLTNAVLVGAGKLGSALLEYGGFEEFGVRIVAGFDCNEEVIKSSKNAILSVDVIEKFCSENGIKIGIITVGQGSAQAVCDKLVACGVKAIWNFAPCTLSVPQGVLLKQERLALSLAHLNSQIEK
ncbi:MAG: redox-sensing transcriptional repressor Rex [Clostridia bacterium]|nr:redox-sensing transcriptional repressor Rex [Clostridia bacterium]